ncbi:MAG: site-specific integrase [Desulfobacteraceae bacterium]|nr:site-specific integrase [Desulfobacteraceae bacterium]
MSVHQTNGNYYCLYYIKDKNGKKKKPKKEYFGKGLEGQKKAIERDQELKLNGRINPYITNPTEYEQLLFIDITEQYLASKANDLPATSINNMMYQLNGVILPELGHLSYDRINHHRLDQYVKKRLKTPVVKRSGKNSSIVSNIKNPDGSIRLIKKTSVHRELSDIIAILNWAVKRNYIPKNHAAGYQKPKRDDEILRPPGEDEIKAILKNAPNHLQRALLINYYTGLRPGVAELFNMTWNDIDWVTKTLLIKSAKKGGISRRSIAIHPDLEKKLIIWKKEDKENKHQFIIHWKGKSVKSIDSSFKTAKKKANITRRIRPYDFRHAAITQMILNGDLKAASEIAGHSSVNMTIKQYEHITTEIKRQTVHSIKSII